MTCPRGTLSIKLYDMDGDDAYVLIGGYFPVSRNVSRQFRMSDPRWVEFVDGLMSEIS